MARKIHIFDTTLRDGEQSAGVAFTPEEKQLLLESIAITERCSALEALYQSYIFDLSGENSTKIH